jgi:Carbohydrate phosphorylase
MRDEVGTDNFFLFGLSVEEVERIKRDGYRPSDYINGNSELTAVLDLIAGYQFLLDAATRVDSVAGPALPAGACGEGGAVCAGVDRGAGRPWHHRFAAAAAAAARTHRRCR